MAIGRSVALLIAALCVGALTLTAALPEVRLDRVDGVL